MGVFTGRSNEGPTLSVIAYPLNPSHSKEDAGNAFPGQKCIAGF